MVSNRLLAHEYYVLPTARAAEVYNQHQNIFKVLEDPFYFKLFLVFSGIAVSVMCILLLLPLFRNVKVLTARLESLFSSASLPIIRLAVGLVLFASAFTHTIFGPELKISSLPMIVSLEPLLFTLGFCFFLGMATSLSSLVIMLVFIDAVMVRGFYMLNYTYFAAVLIMYISKYSFNISNNTKLAVIRIGLGVSLLYTAVTVKLMHPGLSLATIYDFNLQTFLPFDPLFIVFGAFVVEALLGVCFIAGLFVRSASVTAFVVYAASLVYFRSENILAHILPMAICLALFFEHRPHISLDRFLNAMVERLFGVKPLAPLKTVILGGGFAGISAGLELSALSEKHAAITLVSDTEYHALHPAFYETATYEQPPRSVAIPLSSIFRDKGVTLKIGLVSRIDTKRKEIVLKNNERIPFDKLVIALGSESNDFNTPGVKEYGIPLKTLDQAMKIQTRIRQLFETACNEETCSPIHIVIGGGGFTGVELAGEMLRYANKLREQFCVPQELVHVHLVHSQPHILSGLDEKIGLSAQKRLSDMGVDMILGSRIASVSESSITLKDDRKVPCSLLIWTAGIKGSAVAGASGLDSDKENHLYVNRYLQAKNNHDVYVCGDAAAFEVPGSTAEKPQFAPAVAQVAKEEGRTVGRNIYYEMTGAPLVPYRYRHMGYVIPVNGKYAYAHLQHFSFKGFSAYILQQLIILQWLLEILPLSAALLRFDTFEMELLSED